MSKEIKINGRKIGGVNPVYIIAEMSANHSGDIRKALEIVHAAGESGADCLKVQTYTADTMTIDCSNKYFLINSGTWKGYRLYDLYREAYMPWDWQAQIKEETEKAGMHFLSTPFDKTAVDFLEDLDVKCYKTASFELVDLPLIKYIAGKAKPVIMSTGMGTLGEIEEAVNTVRKQGNEELCLLHCCSAYPALTDGMNLRTINNVSETFGVAAGLSDHSAGSLAAIAAVSAGAKVIEKHFCLSRKIKNPDSSFSMEPGEFGQMVRDIRSVEKALGEVSYGVSEQEETSRVFRRSIFAVKDIKKGERFTEKNIRVIRPGDGLLPGFYEEILGSKATADIKRGTPLEWRMVD